MEVFSEDPKLSKGIIELLTKRLTDREREHDENQKVFEAEKSLLLGKLRDLEGANDELRKSLAEQSHADKDDREESQQLSVLSSRLGTLRRAHRELQEEHRVAKETLDSLAKRGIDVHSPADAESEVQRLAAAKQLKGYLENSSENAERVQLSSIPSHLATGEQLTEPLPDIVRRTCPDVDGAISFLQTGGIDEASQSWYHCAAELLVGHVHELCFVTNKDGTKYLGTYEVTFKSEIELGDLSSLSASAQCADALCRAVRGKVPSLPASSVASVRQMFDIGLLRVKCFAFKRLGLNKKLQQEFIKAAPAVVKGRPDSSAGPSHRNVKPVVISTGLGIPETRGSIAVLRSDSVRGGSDEKKKRRKRQNDEEEVTRDRPRSCRTTKKVKMSES
ncbi:hypothetical protein K488DRAFT_85369 [Vararia minispora EC-137]|uniref:Uncharacterized protein n=1 Tax=Vararia minispora EC-137 TaxID=1314806 RepID=A0ACB8QM56_9AGAM|nr:hypothetical protein K488DRAFT_85369 [Vararia minispora EC-137]